MYINKKKLIFVGAFEPSTDEANAAVSAAGNLVQTEILATLRDSAESNNMVVAALAHRPVRAWPYGQFWVRGQVIGGVTLPAFCNLPIIKHLFFGLSLLISLLKERPVLVLAYNPGPFESLALIIYKKWQSAFLVSIVQDIHVGSVLSIRALSDRLAMLMARKFDVVAPVSHAVVEDFSLLKENCVVFRGGMTKQTRHLINVEPDLNSLMPYAVFAGALESYNGFDVLVQKWLELNSDLILHVFGKGSLSSLAISASELSNRVVYHGFVNEDIVAIWQEKAVANFCLRYSIGIDQRYFFPSKFFNVLAAPGGAIVNKIEGFPLEIGHACLVVDDDLSNLADLLDAAIHDVHSSSNLNARRDWLRSNASWMCFIDIVFKRVFGCPKLERF